MALRIGFLGVAHMHAWGYAPSVRNCESATLGPVYEEDPELRARFARDFETSEAASPDALFQQCDAVIITSENKRHAAYAELAAKAGKHILCEKPLVTTEEEGEQMLRAAAAAGVKLMTAFPCRYSPAFWRLCERVWNGDIGEVRGICATNRGSCPFGWFVQTEKSGGGAMIDHVVHVADLLRVLLKDEPVRVQAQIGNNMYGKEWEDTAMLTIDFQGGVFATLDSSWSRPSSFKTWGDVTMNVVGDNGVIELDMFGQEIDLYRNEGKSHVVAGYGSGLDDGLVADFAASVLEDREPPITGFDGLQAARVAIAGYRSVDTGQPVAV
jgi:predicted dehydrogenase